MQYPNIYSLFSDRVKKYRSNTAPRNVFYFRSDDQWKGISWDCFDEETRNFATALLSMGLPVGTSVAILMGNVPEWPISDLGTIMAGGVGVGLYPSVQPNRLSTSLAIQALNSFWLILLSNSRRS